MAPQKSQANPTAKVKSFQGLRHSRAQSAVGTIEYS
jgi:hypothetical protein